MDEKIVGKIIGEVFKKAKNEHASHSKFALSNHISNESDLSSRTLERAYDRYINNKKKYGVPQAESIDLFCKYLGYEDFRGYIERNPSTNMAEEPLTNRSGKRKSIIPISIALGLVLLIFGFQKWFPNSRSNNLIEDICMTWADASYVTVDCKKGPYSDYGTKIEPIDEIKLKNFKQVHVSQAYPFFLEDGKPLIWYSKTKKGEIDYFTSPGLHPVTGETLRKITRHIIQKYVPMHIHDADSFIN